MEFRLTSFFLYLFCYFKLALHHGAITCVQFNPLQLSKVVTNGMDSKILVVDLGSGNILKQFQHSQFQTSYNWSSCCFSPDGKFFFFRE